MAPSGLRSSIWASAPPSHGSRARYNTRSLSIHSPAEAEQQQQQQQQQIYHLPPPPPPTHPPTSRRSPVSANNAPTGAITTTTAVAAAKASGNGSSSSNAPRASNVISPALAFHRFEQACQRLRWKYIDLGNSYKRALSPDEWGFSAPDAERSFKVDFHEFYAWIEQTLVLALFVFGVAVSRDRRFGEPAYNNNNNNNSDMYSNNNINNSSRRGARGGIGAASHSYHHNVLRALDEADNPLHGPLGSGDVNHALWKAKELRNRWKDAAEGRETPPLKMYDLTWIVTTILGGLEVAYGMAYQRVEELKSAGDGELETAMEISEGADAWEWMVEMDWES